MGFSGGVMQTSGKAQIAFPEADLQEISRPFAKTLLAMSYPSVLKIAAPRRPSSSEVCSSTTGPGA